MDINKLVCKIEKNNQAFDNMTPAEKRVQIAKDALLSLKSGFLEGSGSFGSFRQQGVGYVEPPSDKDLKDYIVSQNNMVCCVCGKSALLIAKVLRKNHYKYYRTGHSFSAVSANICNYLDEFTLQQLNLIECAFEVTIFDWSGGNTKENLMAIEAYKRYSSRMRLELILKNIIRNKGEFVIPRRVVRKFNQNTNIIF